MTIIKKIGILGLAVTQILINLNVPDFDHAVAFCKQAFELAPAQIGS